ncbi:MAG: hypothetical protein M0R46_03050 [Candidatus Muirbacterium halophilum]|nr:hypothetical protein [Candidatus Muirbacterium halophilum]MCK9474868.1 hypothetical protein [Candidatus Muirbacterium halophilum]
MKRVILLLLILICTLNSYSIEYYVDTKEINFGSKIKFTIEFDDNEKLKEFSPKFYDFELLSVDTVENKVNYNLFPIGEGNLFINSQDILITDLNEDFTVKTDTIEIFVNTLIGDSENFSPAPLAPFFDIYSKYSYLAITILIIVIVLIIAIILYFLLKNKIKLGLLEKIKEKPHKKALRELEELKLKNYIESNRQKEYCLDLSSILRNYIEGRFSFYCGEMTTAEIERFYFSNKDYIPDFHYIVQMFQKMDLVKFAKYSMEADELNKMFDFTKDYVLKTREVENDEN